MTLLAMEKLAMFLAHMYTGVELFYVSGCLAGYQPKWREKLLSCKGRSNSQLVAIDGWRRMKNKQISSQAQQVLRMLALMTWVLGKLKNTQFNDNAGTGNVSLPGTASAVQGSVVAEPVINELSGSQVNTSEMLNSSDPASTAAAYRGRLWLCWIACQEAPV